MQKKDKIQLAELMLKFNSMNGDIHGFHAEWQLFLDSLSKEDARHATEVMFDSMLNNAKELRQSAVNLYENGNENTRQFVVESAEKLIEHPAFDKKRAAA